MKRMKSISGLITVISLFFCVIWLSPVFAADEPVLAPLGQIRAEGMYVPGALDLDDAGNLYVADGRNGHVFVFDKYGALVDELSLGVTGRGLAVTPDGGKLFVALESSVVVYDFATGSADSFLADFGVVGEIDLDAEGNIYVVDAKALHVNVFSPSGEVLSTFGESGVNAGQFMQLGGLTVDGGQVYVTDQSGNNGQVHVFTLDPVSLAKTGVVTYPRVDTGLFTALGLTFDAQGRIYVVDYVKSMVRVYQPDMSKYLADPVVGVRGRDVGQLSDVNDVIFDKVNNRLLVSCGSRIEAFGVDGGSSPVYVNHAPTTPVPQSPTAGSQVATLNPTLVINNATDEDGDALTYSVILYQGDTPVFTSNVAGGEGGTTAVSVDVQLEENEVYSWTVQASDGSKSSDVSVPASFAVNVTEEVPVAPVLNSPVSGESIDGAGELSWDSVTDPDPNDTDISYLVTVASDPLFEQVVASESLAETAIALNGFDTYGDLVGGDSYFWNVVALDSDGDSSDSSEAGQFVYETTTLAVSANVPGAMVSLHGNHAFAGQELGFAPFEMNDFTPGAMSVVVERAGFEPFVAPVSITEGDRVDLYAEMVPAMVVDKLSESRNGINGRSGLGVGSDAAPFLVDFDNDGDLDMLVGDGSGSLSLYRNMQMAGRNRLYFDQGEALAAKGSVPFVVDWNDDGKKDLVVGQVGGAVKLYSNVGTEIAPAFDSGTDLILPVGSNAAPAVVDFNGDGFKDLLVGDASGQLTLYLNGNNGLADGAPLDIPSNNGPVIPMPVDWDADGQQDLLISSDGVVSVYRQVDGKYQPAAQFDDRRNAYVAAFPIDLDGSGKQMLVGQADGQVVFLTGNSKDPVTSFYLALQDKAVELSSLVDETHSAEAGVIESLIDAGDYAAAADATSTLIAVLPDGDALQSAIELLALLQ